MSQDYTNIEELYQIFLEKINNWFQKGNKGILYSYMPKLLKDIPDESIEELIIRAIADNYIKPRVLCQCPECNTILMDDNKRPDKDKVYSCCGCDEEFRGDCLEVTLELEFTEDIGTFEFFRPRKSKRLLETKNCSF